MKKYLIYTDCHFSQYSSIVRTRGERYSTRLHNLINSISWAERLADREKCDEVLCLGDFFDSPDLHSEEITALQDVYFSSKPHTFITGNHDANISNLEFSSMQIFKAFKATVITEPEKRVINDLVDFYFIPYITGGNRVSIKDYVEHNNKKKIVFTHNDLAGLQYGKFVSQSGFNVNEVLENCTLLLDGHLHNGCIVEDRIVLVGNLTGQNFNEDATRYAHYAYILTIEDDGAITLEPRENPFAFNFYKLYINKEEDIAILNSLKDNAVVSVSCNSRFIQRVTDILSSKSNVDCFRVVTLYSNSGVQQEVVDFKVEDHLQQFIDYVQTRIQPSDVLTEELTNLSSM